MTTAKQKLALSDYEFNIGKYNNTTDYKSVQETKIFIYEFNRILNDDIKELEDYIYSLSTKQSAFNELENNANIVLKLIQSDDIYIKNTLIPPKNLQFFKDVVDGDFRYELKLNELVSEFEKINTFFTEAHNNLRFISLKDFTEKEELERIKDVEDIFRSVISSMDRNLKAPLDDIDKVIEYLGNFDFEPYQNRYPKFYKKNR